MLVDSDKKFSFKFELASGNHNIEIISRNALGTSSTSSYTSVISGVDNKGPVIAPVSPKDGEHVSIQPNEITFTVSDSQSDINADSIKVFIDGTEITSDKLVDMGTGKWKALINPVTDGAHSITASAYDEIGNISTSNWTFIVDTTKPVLTVPANKTVEATGIKTPVEIGKATASDLFSVTITNNAPESYPLGTTDVIWTAKDVNGNVSTAVQKITVVDTTKPVLIVPADVETIATGEKTLVDIGNATATDIFDVTITNDATSAYIVGITIVTWFASDVNGNTSTAIQKVKVVAATNTPTPTYSATPTATPTPTKATPTPTVTSTPTKATPTKATPTKATPTVTPTPTKATPTKATPTVTATPTATPTKATPTKATPTKATATPTPSATAPSGGGGGVIIPLPNITATPTAVPTATPTATPTKATLMHTLSPTPTATSTPVVSIEPTPKIPSSGFEDIIGHWAEKYISKLIKRGFISGYNDGTIKPNNSITRAEIVKMLVNAAGYSPSEKKSSNFADNNKIPSWAMGYVITAAEKGMVKGYKGNNFSPSSLVTRAEMTVMIMRAFGYEMSNKKGMQFKDADKIPSWASDYISKAYEMKIIQGYSDNEFKPNKVLSRAEAFVIIEKCMSFDK
ncbi:S-layer domain-containing protein [Pseudobacteroides cellulosolvens ATCC 35603 = DSM 2933]|uniref:S-layer domain-containing protein n=1 Tax=Pseudobacteroides cellulosolvens ATCC 35603 = DSM 2933 TaxID=398512 RepID=A0A0L6JKH4_9FIRM|nr:S-layer domain-containing protein [Pseudobacteroides cellulosolvens ATCC 35603 = DSM 2933]